MAIIPRMPSDSFDELLSNLQQAQAKGQPRGMALPHTYLRFYKKSEIVALGIINSAIVLWLTLAILTRVLLVQSLVFRLKYFFMAGGFAQTQAGTSRPEWNYWYEQSPYGDDPQDQFWIQQGIDYTNRQGY